MGDATPSSGENARDDGVKELGSSSTNASAISFGFAATAILISMFLLMAIFEHLIKPGWASAAAHDGDGDGQSSHSQPAGRHPGGPRDHGSPDKLAPPPKMEEEAVVALDLTVVMPGQRYPTFLAQPAPLLLACCPREGMRWPPHHHGHQHSLLPP